MSSTPKGLETQRAPITGAYPSSMGAHTSWELRPEQRADFEERGYLSPIQLLEGAAVEALRARLSSIKERLDELEPLLYEVEESWLERPEEVVLHFLGAWRVDEWITRAFASACSETVPPARLIACATQSSGHHVFGIMS